MVAKARRRHLSGEQVAFPVARIPDRPSPLLQPTTRTAPTTKANTQRTTAKPLTKENANGASEQGNTEMTVTERLLAKVKKSDGCWLWTGAISIYGYARFLHGGKNRFAHRVAYTLFVGPIPDGMSVCHKCDTPRCINPDHLFLGTLADNMMDCVSKGRHYQAKKIKCPKGHPYTPENTGLWGGRRNCLICSRLRKRKKAGAI